MGSRRFLVCDEARPRDGRRFVAQNSGMGIVWDQRIRHMGRKVERREHRFLASRDRASGLRQRLGLPSRNLSSDLVFEGLAIRMDVRTKPAEVVLPRKHAFELKLIGSRLLERKHRMKGIVRSRKITRDRTCLFLWKRRHEWLAMAEDRVQS